MPKSAKSTSPVPEPVVIIPFRDRGTDPLRRANLLRVMGLWCPTQWQVWVADDGRTGDAQFNRSAAYNRGAADLPDAQVYVFTESDMLVNIAQVVKAVALATESPGLVVPFTEYHYLTEPDSQTVRDYAAAAHDFNPEWIMADGRSVGAINVISRVTLDLVGRWDETFCGSWYDDRAMAHAFECVAGPTRYVDGPAYHLYHRPGWTGSHLTAADRAATARNKGRLALYQHAATPQRIRELTAGGI